MDYILRDTSKKISTHSRSNFTGSKEWHDILRVERKKKKLTKNILPSKAVQNLKRNTKFSIQARAEFITIRL